MTQEEAQRIRESRKNWYTAPIMLIGNDHLPWNDAAGSIAIRHTRFALPPRKSPEEEARLLQLAMAKMRVEADTVKAKIIDDLCKKFPDRECAQERDEIKESEQRLLNIVLLKQLEWLAEHPDKTTDDPECKHVMQDEIKAWTTQLKTTLLAQCDLTSPTAADASNNNHSSTPLPSTTAMGYDEDDDIYE